MSSAGLERRGPAPSGIVTILTDFGLDDAYVGIVKGVILAINPAAHLVDLTHAVPPQDVLRGALALDTAYRFFPPGTVHLAVVDPGVGGPRRALALSVDGHYFVGPDNGLFGFLLAAPRLRAVRLASPAYRRGGTVSRTFHARDVFAPAAAHCSLGVPLERFGPPVHDPVRLDWPRPSRVGRRLVGRVLLADRFGNLLTNLAPADLPGPAADCVLEIAGQRIEGIVGTYGERPLRALGSVVDSSGRLEVFVREGSARDRLGVGPGAAVSLWSRSSSRTRSSRTTSSGVSSSRTSSPRTRSSGASSSRVSSSRTSSPRTRSRRRTGRGSSSRSRRRR
jgi:S-adenosyl-L-methionine hydrolase (adenosine-forming)